MSSIFIYGRPGSGKTTLAASMTKLNLHVHFLDMDRKIPLMKNLQQQLEQEQLTYWQPQSPLVEESLREIAQSALKYYPRRQPKGYLELVDQLEHLKQHPQGDVLVLDSISRVNEHLKRLLKFFQRKPKLDFDGWDAILNNYEELFSEFYRLQPEPYKHCIIIAHAKDDTIEELKTSELKPLLDGQFRDKVGGYVEELYFATVEATNPHQPAKYWVVTKPVGKITQARSSRPLPTRAPADFSLLFKQEDRS